MKFSVFGRMQSCPSIDLETRIDPLDFDASIRGHFSGELGPFKVHVGSIPIHLAVPFLKRRPLIASIGGFSIDLQRFRVDVDKAGLDLKGTLGLKGIKANVQSKIDCSTEMKLDGDVTGRVGLSHLELGEEHHT